MSKVLSRNCRRLAVSQREMSVSRRTRRTVENIKVCSLPSTAREAGRKGGKVAPRIGASRDPRRFSDISAAEEGTERCARARAETLDIHFVQRFTVARSRLAGGKWVDGLWRVGGEGSHGRHTALT